MAKAAENRVLETKAYEGERIIIRRLRKSDSKSIFKHAGDKEIVRWTISIPHPYYIEHAESFTANAYRKWKAGKAYLFGIILKKHGGIIGVISLIVTDKENKTGEIGYWIGIDYWNKGYMTEAAGLIIRFGFDVLELHRLEATAFELNKASQRVLEKTGFVKEGILREAIFRDGKWHDKMMYGILNS